MPYPLVAKSETPNALEIARKWGAALRLESTKQLKSS